MQLFLPAAYRTAVGPEGGRMGGVSVAIALVLLVTYTLNLLFVLVRSRTSDLRINISDPS